MGNSSRARPRLGIPQTPVRFVAEGAEALGTLIEVSRSGLYVRSSEPPRPGAIVALQFESPTGKLVDVRGEVRWSAQGARAAERPDGFGVQVHEPPREYRDFVSWALAQCEQSDQSDQSDDGEDDPGEL